MAFDPNRRFAWVRNQVDKTIVPYSIERGGKLIKQQELIQTVILSDSAQGLAVHDGGASLYAPWEIRLSSLPTSPPPSGGLHRYLIEHNGSLSLAAEIATPAIPRAVAASPNRRFILVVAQGSSRYGLQAYTTDPLTGKVLQIGATVPTGSYPEDVKVASNSQVAYVVNSGDDSIGVYRTDTMSGTPTLLQTVLTGHEPLKIALAPNGRFAAVAHHGDDSVSLFATSPDGKLSLKGKLATGYHPFDVGFAPDSQHFYTADFGRSTTAPSIPSTLSMYAIDAAGQTRSLGRVKTGGDGAVKVDTFTP
jgi:6-phosphogluconolactonase (cycloisomerase 2 family)